MNVFFFVSLKNCKNPTKNNVSLFKILYLSYLFHNIRIKEVALMVINFLTVSQVRAAT